MAATHGSEEAEGDATEPRTRPYEQLPVTSQSRRAPATASLIEAGLVTPSLARMRIRPRPRQVPGRSLWCARQVARRDATNVA